MDNLTPCPNCKKNNIKFYHSYMIMIYCDNCYDAEVVGDPLRYCSNGFFTYGKTESEAITAWNEKAETENY